MKYLLCFLICFNVLGCATRAIVDKEADRTDIVFKTDGTNTGFYVKKLKKGSVFEKMGLEEGDIIIELNGEALTTAQKTIGILNKIEKERIEFEVLVQKWNGEKRKMRFQF